MADNTALNETLRGIIEHQGRNLLDDTARCEQVLNDSKLSEADAAALLTTLKEGVPRRLLRTVPARITADTVTGLAHKLAGDNGLSADAARQSVEAWAYALRVEIDAPAPAAIEPPKPETVAAEAAQMDTFKSQATQADTVAGTPPPPIDSPPKPPLKIKAALLTPVGAIVGGIAGIVISGIYYIVTMFVLNFVFQHHLSQGEVGEIAGRTAVVVGMPCGVLAGISWIELRYKYDWLGWTVAAVCALLLAVYPFVHGIAPIFKLWVPFGAFGLFALFGLLGIAGKLSEVGAKKRF